MTTPDKLIDIRVAAGKDVKVYKTKKDFKVLLRIWGNANIYRLKTIRTKSMKAANCAMNDFMCTPKAHFRGPFYVSD